MGSGNGGDCACCGQEAVGLILGDWLGRRWSGWAIVFLEGFAA